MAGWVGRASFVLQDHSSIQEWAAGMHLWRVSDGIPYISTESIFLNGITIPGHTYRSDR